MKQFTLDKKPSDMFTKAGLKKLGLYPISEHSAYVTYPQNKRRYKLYKIENARPINKNEGYSLLIEITETSDKKLSLKERFQEIRNRRKSF